MGKNLISSHHAGALLIDLETNIISKIVPSHNQPKFLALFQDGSAGDISRSLNGP